MITALFTRKFFQAIIFCLLIILGCFFVYSTWKKAEKEQSICILKIARTCVALMPIDDIKKLNGIIDDTSKLEYKRINQHLFEIVHVDNNIQFAYIWVNKKNKIYFLSDSELKNSKDYSPPGQEYTEAKFEDKKPFLDGKEFITSELTDRWGTWRSIYVPIKDKTTDKIIAVLGLDFDASSWRNNVISAVIESVILIILIIVLFLILINVFVKNNMLNKILTERRNAEKALVNSELKFRNLVEASSDIIWETNINGVYTYISPQIENILGYKSSDLLGKSPFENMPPDEAIRVKKISDEIISSKKAFDSLINTLIDKNGKLKIFETSGVPIFNNDGSLIGYRGVDRDITERKQNEELIINANKKVNIILDVAGEGILGIDKKGAISFINPMASNLLGYDREELLAQDCHSKIHHSYQNGDVFPKESCPNYSTLKSAKQMSGEDYYWRKNGTGFYVAYSTSPIIENDVITGSVITFVDITERKKEQNEIIRKSNELERFNKLLINRELRMIELKKEINELYLKLGGSEKYKNKID
ncbi:MAG: PAS domain S-box protein [Bacteroidia bacterium]|nr:PAS domain S-box protein [Bacteroidia bacterium]